MAAKEKQDHPKRNAAFGPMPEPDPGSLKDNPDGETVCSPYFSKGCVNEDTDSSSVSYEEDDDEGY